MAGKDKDSNGKNKKVLLEVSVSGAPVKVNAEVDLPLLSIFGPALEKAGMAADSDPDKWQFTDEPGNVLDRNKVIVEFGFAEKTTIFLSLLAGVAGI